MNTLYTVGHSNHKLADFIALLKGHDIEAIADVRSAPYSRYSPQYNKDALQQSLNENGIAYVYLGKELGARREEQECWRDGEVDFSLLARLPIFLSGIQRLIEGSAKMRVAIMCAEKDPMNCHRNSLISRHLETHPLAIRHILADGSLVEHRELRSATPGGSVTADLFNQEIEN